MADALTEILRAASKHPNSRVSKLIHTVEEEPSQKNIVLLLIELAEHAEYSTDFNVSLKYYLDLFEHLGINSDLVLNEAGLLLVNSSKIYSKRVDYVQSLVERQILTLSNADDELQKQKLEQQAAAENAATPAEKPKRGRKRALEAPSDPYEVELTPKKFKKLTEEKRFAAPKTPQKAKSVLRNIEMEQHIHPAGWLHATIYDLENEEDVDTKRNYKLFTYHVEHRYNTLVPDINFRLHFKVKDYIDEQEEMEADEACNTDRSWPPLSEAYVQKYLRLENYVLQQDLKVNKRKAAEMEEDDDFDKSQDADVIIKDDNDDKNESQLEQTLLDCSTAETAAADITKDNLDSTNLNGKNDSGLGQSLLDESVPLDSTNTENLNDTNLAEPNKSLNVTENLQENDSALGTSVLDQTSNTENNTTGNLDNTTNSENLNETNTEESHKSLNITENQQENDSALGTSVLDQTGNTENNTTTEEATGNLDTTTNGENLNETNEEEANKSLNATENDSALSNSVLDQTNNTTTETEANLNETTAETSEILETTNEDATIEANETTTEIVKEGDESANPAALTIPIENRKDSALSDDRHHSISTENLAISTENLNKIDDKTLQIDDLVTEKDKDNNQLQVQLPHTDDEGVYLSDLEEHDCRMLSPTINATNILPGVERKDVTIYMDDELRQALDMRDGIMEHFSHETYKVPVIIEPKKQNLLFNIFKLPEKLVRRKVIFKLGPEMDLYLQARSLKRSRPEQPTRSTRVPQLLQWFSLNNTDMTGVCMSPPYSPGHCSEFYGFSDDEDDDTLSCAEFCGFTEEEQSTLMIKHNSRLSRDSGVGVDVNALTPEKETLEIIFEEGDTSAIDNCKKVLNLDQMPENSEQSTEAILNQLPEEIRDVLTTELEGNNETTAAESQKTETQESCSKATESQVSINNTEDTENMATGNSVENSESLSSENPSTNNTQESDMQLTECSTVSQKECSESTEPLATNESQEATTETPVAVATEATTSESQDKVTDLATESEMPRETNVEKKDDDVEIKDIIISIPEENNKSAEELLKEKLDAANSMEESDNFDNQLDITEDCDSDEDDEMLDLDTQGTKTKIQQWHEHLQPILAKSRERHHFDVFKLGSEIIETVQSTKLPQDEEETFNENKSKRPVASFQDIMDNKDTSYVSRYFLSTLLLANQSNIEISINNKSSEKPSSWQDIQLKLLSTKRHTVAIEDNIGMIDNKLKVSDKNAKDKQNTNTVQAVDEEEEDEPLIKLQTNKKSPKKTKTSLKRSNDNNTTANIALKKPKEITHSRHNELPNLIESVQIIKSPQVKELNLLPSTSRQAQLLNTTPFNVNISNVRTLQPIEKVQHTSDDYDSGIFSVDEMSTS